MGAKPGPSSLQWEKQKHRRERLRTGRSREYSELRARNEQKYAENCMTLSQDGLGRTCSTHERWEIRGFRRNILKEQRFGRPTRMWLWSACMSGICLQMRQSDGYLQDRRTSRYSTLSPHWVHNSAWLRLCVLYTSRQERPCEPYTQWLGQFTWQHPYKYVTSYVYICACVSNSPSLVHIPIPVRFPPHSGWGTIKKIIKQKIKLWLKLPFR